MNENGKTEEIELEETQVIENVEARETAETQAETPKKGWAALSRNAKIGIGAGCAAVLAAAVAGACVWSNQPATLPANEPVGSAQLAEPAEEGTPQKATLGYAGYEPKEGDTPVIVHVTGTTDGNRSVDFYHLVSGASGDVELDPGMYTAELLPVLLEDGSMISPKDGQAAFPVDGAAAQAQQAYDAKAEADVTEADLAALLDKIAEATAKGDETLKGDAGKVAASKAAEAVKATGKMDAEKVEQAEERAAEGSNGAPQVTVYSVSFQGGQAVANSSSSTEAAPASSSSAATTENTGSSSNASPAPAAPSGNGSANQPAHEHSWQAVTEQKWVSNNVWVEDSAAWDEPIYGQQTRSICNGCGADITGNPWAHIEAAGRGSACSGYHGEAYSVVTNTIHHDATGHYEDQGHYETVTTGYRCSTCGATK